MNKEYLEALNGLFDLIHCQDSFEKAQKYYDVIEQALQRLESIDNANPSTALELVGYLKDYHLNAIPYYDWLNDIEKYILKAQKEHKALEIIKGKEVNMQVFNQCEDAETYNKVYIKQKDRQLTGEEFETLKEVEEWVKN